MRFPCLADILKPLATSRTLCAGLTTLITLCGSLGQAQTYTWDRHALGQMWRNCQYLNPDFWPNNNNWSQAYQTNNSCDHSTILASAPSNWDPWLPVGVYPGGPGAVGVDVVIGGLVDGTNNPALSGTYVGDAVRVTVNNLTLQPTGALGIGYFSWVLATNADIQTDTIIGPGGYAGAFYIAAGGSLTKSGGTGTLGFGKDGYGNPVGFGAANARLIVQSGTFAMPYKSAGSWMDGTFVVASNASVLLSVDNNCSSTLAGSITGVGAGTVMLNTGALFAGGTDFYDNYHPGLLLDFPGAMFQWSGGVLRYGPVTNIGVLNLSHYPGMQCPLYNNGLMNLADNSSLGLIGGGGNILYNNPGGHFDIKGDSGITDNGHGVINSGWFQKSAGAGAALISTAFRDYNGTVEADAGTLNLLGCLYFTNTAFVVSNGAAIDLFTLPGNFQIDGHLTGSGAGTVLMSDGSVICGSPTTLDFPGAMFQWQGGRLGYGYGLLMTNLGTLNVSGPVGVDGYLANSGTMVQSGAGLMANGYLLQNDPSAVYDIQNDNGFAVSHLYNYGIFKKTAGSGTSIVAGDIANWGPIQVTSGALLFTNGTFYQNAGTLQLSSSISCQDSVQLNGGTITGVGLVGTPDNNVSLTVNGGVLAPGNPFGTLTSGGHYGFSMGNDATLQITLGGSNLFSQLAVIAGNAYIGGTLNVTLTNGYAPAIGTQFQIVSGNRGYTFAKLNVPRGISVNYSNNGVFLVVTSAVPAIINNPQISGTNFTFSFGTINGQSYTVQQNNNLTTTNWITVTNILGDGSLYQFLTPQANLPQSFFRVSQP